MAEAPKAPPPAVPPPAPKKTAPPPAPAAATAAAPTTGKVFSVTSGREEGAQRIVIYGPGGIGKTSCAALAPDPVFFDLEMGTREIELRRVKGVDTWSDLREAVRAVDGCQTVVIDTVTKAEELAIAHVLRTVKTDKNEFAVTPESYGWGKGYQHIYDTFLLLLTDLDGLIRAGRNVILIAHDCVANVPNPSSEDFIRYEPHLQTSKGGKASIRSKVFQWADHVFFIGYDVAVKDGKGRGAGTRTIFPKEMPTHMAKSRRLADNMAFDSETDASLWAALFGKG